MTTIAANREEMAADSQGTRESGLIVSRNDRKVRRLAGDIVSCAGNEDQCLEFEAWYEAGRDMAGKPDLEKDFGALVLTADGKLFKFYERGTPVEVFDDFIALGSGDEIAMGAMAVGATPEEAVEAACRLNMYTGSPVVVERLKESPGARARRAAKFEPTETNR